MAVNINGTGSITGLSSISSPGISGVPVGSASAPAFSFTGDTNTGIYSPGADQVAVATNGAGRLFVDANGNIGAGYSTPGNFAGGDLGATRPLVVGDGTASTNVNIFSDSTGYGHLAFSDGTSGTSTYAGLIQYYHTTDSMALYTAATVRLLITSAGLVGIGTSSPQALLHCESSSQELIRANSTNASGGYISVQSSGTNVIYIGSASALSSGASTDATVRAQSNLLFTTGGGVEKARLDTSGRLLVGTSSARSSGGHTGSFQLEGTTFATATAAVTTNSNDSNGAYLNFGKARGGSIGSTTIVQNADVLGQIQFNGSDGASLQNAAFITALVDGTPGGGDMPGRLVFSTTADGATSPTERLRIDSSGNVGIGTTSGFVAPLHVSNGGAAGLEFYPATYEIQAYNRSTSAYGLARYNAAGHQFAVSASEAARIDASGRLLVGTTSPYSNDDSLVVQKADASARIGLQRSETGQITTGEELGAITFYSNDGDVNPSARISAEADLDHAVGDKPGRLVFSVTEDGESSPRERMRISQDGKISIGLGDTINGPLQVYNGNSSQGVAFVASDGSGNEWHFGRGSADGYFYVVRQTGTGMYMNTNSWVATSDQRAKQNIADIESTIDVVKALKPSRFNWKADGSADVGFIAQQVQPLIPEAVVDSGDPDAMLGITQDKLLPFVVKALQEAVAKIESLEARLTAAGV
jgi:hypothetical protein